MTRTDRFLKLYKELETELGQRFRLPNGTPYYILLERGVKSANKTICHNEDFLRSLGSLRNILVHVSYGPEHIAEISSDALERFEAIVEHLTRPARVRDVMNRPVTVFEETDALLVALQDMKTNDYSQIVVRRGGQLGLVSTEGLTHWMLQGAGSVGLLDPAATLIGDVGKHEPKASCRFMKPDQAVDEVRVAFLDGISMPSTRLYAILITQNAKATETPLGIVTPWDVFDQ